MPIILKLLGKLTVSIVMLSRFSAVSSLLVRPTGILHYHSRSLHLTKSATTGYTPAFVLYGREPILPLEHAVCKVTDCPVASVSDKVSGMQQTVELVKRTLNRTAAAM